MKHIKLYESYNSDDDEDVEYILADYYHDNKCEIIKNDYYKLYRFNNVEYYNEAIGELIRHKIEYKSIRIINSIIYIITQLSQEIVDFLNNNLLSLNKKEVSNYIYYLNDIKINKTKTYYSKSRHIFYIDSTIWHLFSQKFNSNYNEISLIFKWYVVNNMQKGCYSIIRQALFIAI